MEAPGNLGKSDPFPAVRRRLVVAALVVGLPVVLPALAWPAAGVSGFGDDTLYYFPLRSFVARWWSEGVWPTWNPLSAMGTSLTADPQAGLFYPGTWLFALLPAVWAYPLTQILHFALAGGGMYRWLRTERMDWRAALLGAIGFAFSAYLVGHRGHLTIHHASAWLPWVFYGWTRFAGTGAYRHFALAVVAYGMHMLVQHMQVTIIMSAVLAAYVVVVLWPRQRCLWWVFPCGVVLGGMIGAIQTLPTYLQFAGSTRQVAAYYVFIENSWSPASAIMFLFPMFFGNTTHTFYEQTWWGISHFCEQFVYGTILLFVLAGASIVLTRREDGRWDRRIVFWWVASLGALVIALGDATPLCKWLFQIPVYRNLRVPARWTLVWSVAMPFLGAAVAHVLLQAEAGVVRGRVERAVRRMVLVLLPLLSTLSLAVIVLAWWHVERLEAWWGDRWAADLFFAGLREAVRPGNAALWIPLILMIATGGMLLLWMKQRRRGWLAGLGMVWLADLASVVTVVDVNSGWMTARDLVEPPVLARKLKEMDPRGTGRLLVPRFYFDGHRPLDVLAPATNVLFEVPAFTSYGPLWPRANRLLFRMEPWGASNSIVELMRNTRLMRAMGIRYVALRSEDERDLFARATVAAVDEPRLRAIPEGQEMVPVPWEEGILWPVQVEEPGLYLLRFRAERHGNSASRWFVSLEDEEGRNLDRTRSIDPVDLSCGLRELVFLFYADQGVDRARVRIKSESGVALYAGAARFGRVGAAIRREEAGRRRNSAALGYRLVADLTTESRERISLYELEGVCDLFYWATSYERVPDLGSVVHELTVPESWNVEATRVIGMAAGPEGHGHGGAGEITGWARPRPDEVSVQVHAEKGGLLIFNETYDAGWEAYVDGRRVEIEVVNGVVQGVWVPAGTREVLWKYRPVGLEAGLWLAGAAWGLLLLTGVWRILPGRRAQRGDRALTP